MRNKEFGLLLEKRTKRFAISIIKLSATIPSTQEGRVIKNQVSKSGTSVGANYREANRSKSEADFKNKIRICEGEASETLYWLEILEELKWVNLESIEKVKKEAQEILSIFTSISYKVRNK